MDPSADRQWSEGIELSIAQLDLDVREIFTHLLLLPLLPRPLQILILGHWLLILSVKPHLFSPECFRGDSENARPF